MASDTYEAVIGLEVHAHLATRSKLFCGCANGFGAGPNENVCPVCMAMPGVLPVLNREAVELAIRMGLAAHCTIAPYSVFARKSYFYPDLPKGYQISMYEQPLCIGGHIDIPANRGKRPIRLVRIHMEEDAGKNIHEGDFSLVDFNRSGVPLVEIVSEPDIRSAEEAAAYLHELRTTLRYVGASEARMEEGNFRCDVNISVRPKGTEKLGVKTEIKNLNSIRFVEKAIAHEVARQIDLLESGGRVSQETHLWDPVHEETRPMRSKEFANDYRYFPEPDLPPLRVTPDIVERLRASIPELPDSRRTRLMNDLGLSEYEATILTENIDLGRHFDELVTMGKTPKRAAGWVINSILRWETERPEIVSSAAAPISGALLTMIEDGELSLNAANTALAELVSDWAANASILIDVGARNRALAKILSEKSQVSDEAEIAAVCDRILAAEPAKIAEYRAGRDKLFGYFVGTVMKTMGGKGNPRIINDLLKHKLAG